MNLSSHDVIQDFKRNLEAFSRFHPKESHRISQIDCNHLSFCQTNSEELNLEIVCHSFNAPSLYYHSPNGAKKEAKEWFSLLDLTNIEILYVYGVGLGYYYEPLIPWLRQSPQHQLIFLEDDLAVLHRLFECKNAAPLLADPQVQVRFFNHIDSQEPLFDWLAWHFYQKPFKISALKYYEKNKSAKYEDLQRKLHFDAALRGDTIREFLDHGAGFFKNFYKNLPKLTKAKLGNKLFNRFRKIPAIICGAGPSLEKNGLHIKDCEQNALIFAGGSALKALLGMNINPHFTMGIDPNAAQHTRLRATQDKPRPFFYRNRIYPEALDIVKGPLLYITGSAGYPISHWFEEKLGIVGETIEEGHNVVNFALEIAYAMGCNPIIFTGLDLAFTNDRLYASGVSDPETEEKEKLSTAHLNQERVLSKNINGEPVYTQWKWIAEAEWISQFAKRHPDVTLINATEDGIGIDVVPNQPLNEISKTWTEELDLMEYIQQCVDEAEMPEVTTENIEKVLNELKDSLRNCIVYLEQMLGEMQVVEGNIKQGKLPSKGIETGKMVLIEVELMEEVAYQAVLEVFNKIQEHLLRGELEELEYRKDQLPLDQYYLKLLAMERRKYQFLKETAAVNLLLTG